MWIGHDKSVAINESKDKIDAGLDIFSESLVASSFFAFHSGLYLLNLCHAFC
jgi:hypothetical protein